MPRRWQAIAARVVVILTVAFPTSFMATSAAFRLDHTLLSATSRAAVLVSRRDV